MECNGEGIAGTLERLKKAAEADAPWSLTAAESGRSSRPVGSVVPALAALQRAQSRNNARNPARREG